MFPQIPDPISLLKRIAETDDVDYKAEFGPGKKGQADFIKDTSAMANSGGGVLVFGVREGILVGIPSEQLVDYDPSRLAEKLKKHLSPVPILSTEYVLHEGKSFPFVKIASISDTPIIVSNTLNGDDNKTALIKPASIFVRQNTCTIELTNPESMRKLLTRLIDLECMSK